MKTPEHETSGKSRTGGKREASRSVRPRGSRPETEAKYREALELYRSTSRPCAEICRTCGVPLSGFQRYILTYHREAMLARYDIVCSREEARRIKLGPCSGPRPATQAKYKEAIEACVSMDYIDCNVSQIARAFGLDGMNLSRQLRTHYPGTIEWREQVRERLGLGDRLPRGARRHCKDRYAEAVKLLRSSSYITMQEAAEKCGVSYAGLKQHLLFYHKDLVKRRIEIRHKAVRRQCKGEITGRGTVHAPTPETAKKYAEAVHLYRTTLLSAAEIARKTGVPKKGFYEHLHHWHQELICARNGIPCQNGQQAELPKIRKFNPETRAKYAEAIVRLKQSVLSTAEVAAEFGLHPDSFRQYLKAHEPELHARQGMVRTEKGRTVSRRSLEKYRQAVYLYSTTNEGLQSIARRFSVNVCSLRDFIKRHFPDALEKHRVLLVGDAL